jgi:hypothetical protein
MFDIWQWRLLSGLGGIQWAVPTHVRLVYHVYESVSGLALKTAAACHMIPTSLFLPMIQTPGT